MPIRINNGNNLSAFIVPDETTEDVTAETVNGQTPTAGDQPHVNLPGNTAAAMEDSYIARQGIDNSSLTQQYLQDLLNRQEHKTPDVGEQNNLLDSFSETPLFVRGSGDANAVAMNDVRQPHGGNSWMMGPLSELALKDPERLKNSIRDNHDGTYTVYLHEKVVTPGLGGGQPSYESKLVTVNGDFSEGNIPLPLPVPGVGSYNPFAKTGDKNAIGGGEIWPQIFEKAYAQSKGGYDKITGGDPAEFMEALTGRPSTSYNTLQSVEASLYGGLSFQKLEEQFNSGSPVVFHAHANGLYGDASPYGLDSNQTYALHRIYTDGIGKQWVELYDPAGTAKKFPFDALVGSFDRVIVG